MTRNSQMHFGDDQDSDTNAGIFLLSLTLWRFVCSGIIGSRSSSSSGI